MGDTSSQQRVNVAMQDDNAITTISTDVLIVGTGPAGASLACFLAFNGVKGLMISSASSTAETPRAHYTNLAALECLRDIGLEDEYIKQGMPSQENYKHARWANTVAGEQYARSLAFGHDPKRIVRFPETNRMFVIGKLTTVTGRLRRCKPLQAFRSATNVGGANLDPICYSARISMPLGYFVLELHPGRESRNCDNVCPRYDNGPEAPGHFEIPCWC
jgi:hypothetical protein